MEIKAKDLRIGNLLKDKYSNEIIKVNGITENDIYFSGNFTKEWQAEPIPLTEEWLLKFGFKFNNPTYEWYDKSAVFFIQVNYLGFDLIAKFHNQTIKEIKYVHELQNLYFALTGKELETKNHL